jgi:hypothetical protein
LSRLSCFIGAIALCVALPSPSWAQVTDVAALAAQFYPQTLVDQTQQDGRTLVREQCFEVLEADSTGPKTVIAGFTDRFDGEVLVLGRGVAGFEVVGQASGMDHFGQTCAAALVDVNGDGVKEAHFSFTTRNSTTDWIYGWDGQQLFNLTPVSAPNVPSGILETRLINASFVDLNGDGLLEVYSFSQPPVDGSAPAASEVFHLSSGRYVLERAVVTVLEFARASGSPSTDEMTVLLPTGAQGPFTLKILNGGGSASGSGRVENAVESGRVWWNGQQIAAPNDFGNQVAVIQRTVTLQAENEIKVRLAGAPGGRITIVIDATNWVP